MKLRLRIQVSEETKSHEVELEGRGAFSIGRQKCDLCITDLNCSRNHALIFQAGDSKVFIRDQGSRNGTKLNGESITESVLNEGDVLTIGETKIAVLEIEADSGSIHQVTLEDPGQRKGGPPTIMPRNPEILAGWPDHFRAADKKHLSKFIDHVDEAQIQKSSRLRALARKRAGKK